jgi:hypothetical protein
VRDEPEIPPEIPPLIADLVLRMLRKDPEARATIEEVQQHPWIRASVLSFYFEKGFLNSLPAGIGRSEAAAVVERLRLDPANLGVEGTEEWILKQVIARQKLAEFVNNGIGGFGSPGDRRGMLRRVTTDGEGERRSLLNTIGQATGLMAKRTALGPGRVIVRASRRQSASLLRIPHLDNRSSLDD